MRLELVREGAAAAAKQGDLIGWRTWAYEAAQSAQVSADGPVMVEAWATARNKPALPHTMSCFRALELVIDGLVAGGVLRGAPHELVDVRLRRPRVTGVDGMVIVVTDSLEPF